jgi:hypothetical protein
MFTNLDVIGGGRWHDGAQMGLRDFTVPGDKPAQGPTATALEPGSDPGGIDFSTLQLRYLGEGKGGKLEYAFDATTATSPDHKIPEGRNAVARASDAFFVWLSLSPSTFWVNLNPNEPDRIIDDRLGTTDVGRILLQADFQMKKLIGSLIYPDTALGQQFWGSSDLTAGSCISHRQWIVPEPASVYEQDGGLYIVDAPLDVKSETEYFQGQADSSCVVPDTALANAFRTLILPKVKEAINGAPEFAELRQVYLSRVAAEWYRERHASGGTLSTLIDSGDVRNWPALQPWSPRDVFNQYVDSYNKHEFNVTRQVERGDYIYETTYTYGGVDFSEVPLNQLTESALTQAHPDLTDVIGKSFQNSVPDRRGKIWLGGSSEPLQEQNAAAAGSSPVLGSLVLSAVAATILVAFLVGFYIRSRRRRVAPAVFHYATLPPPTQPWSTYSPAPQRTPPPPPPTTKPPSWPWVLLVVVLLLVGGGITAFVVSRQANDPAAGPAPTIVPTAVKTPDATRTVRYEVISTSGRVGRVIYIDDNGVQQALDIASPWSKDLTTRQGDHLITLTGQNGQDGDVTCRITVGGTVRVENHQEHRTPTQSAPWIREHRGITLVSELWGMGLAEAARQAMATNSSLEPPAAGSLGWMSGCAVTNVRRGSESFGGNR